MAPAWSAAALAALLAGAGAVKVEPRQLRGAGAGSLTLTTYRGDCFRRHRQALLGVPKPGSGMNPTAIQPFAEVLKDGFYEVDCVKDYLFEHGDKFGDNRASYKLGEVSNISIVHYSAHVAKEDREEMTHETCFKFCRSVPDMLFFGITNGRDCYCAPYYKAEADDSSQCDAPCDGNPTAMCGGKSKSSIFAMHQCGDTAQELQDASLGLASALQRLAELAGLAGTAGQGLQSYAAYGQALLGHAGDAGASDLMQTAKVRAGELLALAAGGEKALADGAQLVQAAGGAGAAVGEAEALTSKLEAAAFKAQAAIKDLEAALARQLRAGALVAEGNESRADQYYSLMYFVDKQYEQNPSTCTGAAAEKPIMATQAACARLCDEDVGDCVGFSFFPGGQQQDLQPPPAEPLLGFLAAKETQAGGLCFLLSRFKTAQYYTDCQGEFAASVKCHAKLSKFEGTSLAPKGDGTCKECLKTATKADRCFE